MTGLPLNIDLQQILLHILNFVILAGGLYILLYKPVKDYMDKRTAYYEDMDQKAKAALLEAQKTQEDYDARLKGVEDEITQLRSDAMKKAQDMADQRVADAQVAADKIIADAKTVGALEKEKILESAREEVADLAAKAAAKILDGEEDIYSDFVSSASEGE